MKHLLIALLLLAAVVEPAHAQEPSAYKYSGYVNDFANAIDDGEEAALLNELKALDANKGVQLAVVTVPTLGGLEPEVFAQELFTNWGIGHKRDNTGVLYLICPGERKQRIHTGYGVEGVLPDIITKRIQRDTEPKMSRTGNLSPALVARVRAISQIVTESNDLGFDSKTAASQDAARNTYAVNPDESVPTEESVDDGTLGNILAGITLLLLSIAVFFWLRKGYRERQKARESAKEVAGLQLTIIDGQWAKAALASRPLQASADIAPVQREQLQDLDAEILGYVDGVKSVYANLDKMSTREIEAANAQAAAYIQNAKSMMGQYTNLEADVARVGIARRLNFEFDGLREEVMRSTQSLQNAIKLVNAKYPVSVWGAFDYVNFEDNLASCFNRMDIIKGKCNDIMKRNLTVDTAKNVVSLHDKFLLAKSEAESIISIIKGKAKEVEQAEARIHSNELAVAYAAAKRNADQNFVSNNTRNRLGDAGTELVRFLSDLKTESNVLKLEVQHNKLLSELNLIKEKAMFDVRKHHQDIADAAAAVIAAEAARVAAIRRKQQDAEDAERRRKKKIQDDEEEEQRRRSSSYSSSYSSSSYDSSSSSSDSGSSFGGGDSGGGGSNDSW